LHESCNKGVRRAPSKKIRPNLANVERASKAKVTRVIEAATEFIRQNTTHLTEHEKLEVQNNIHGRKRGKEIALGDAVMHSIRDFHTWCNKDPVLSNESRLQAQRIVAMATLPICDARFDRLYSKKTGVDRKKLDDVRDRRANVGKHHLTEEGIFGSKREPRGTLIPWDMQNKAISFWFDHTAPRNEGAGENCQDVVRSQKGRLADAGMKQGPEDKSYFEIYLDWRKLCEVEYPNLRIMSFPSIYRLKPFQIKSRSYGGTVSWVGLLTIINSMLW